MNAILLTAIIFTVAHSGQGGFSDGNHMISNWAAAPTLQPCQQKSSISRYETFVTRHILKVSFDRNSEPAWARYLQSSGLCGREPVQSFIDAPEGQVRQICSRAGWRVQGATGSKGNLCISGSAMTVHEVKSDKNCAIYGLRHLQKNVIVACDKINNHCFPVHFEGDSYSRQNIPCNNILSDDELNYISSGLQEGDTIFTRRPFSSVTLGVGSLNVVLLCSSLQII